MKVEQNAHEILNMLNAFARRLRKATGKFPVSWQTLDERAKQLRGYGQNLAQIEAPAEAKVLPST